MVTFRTVTVFVLLASILADDGKVMFKKCLKILKDVVRRRILEDRE